MRWRAAPRRILLTDLRRARQHERNRPNARAGPLVRSRRRIDFSTSDQPNVWISLSQAGLLRHAVASVDAPLWCRIWMLALTRIDADGHSMWVTHELANALPLVSRQNGELRTPSDRQVRRAVRKLVDLGWVCADSETRCMRFAMRDAQNPIGSSGRCFVHTSEPVRPASAFRSVA